MDRLYLVVLQFTDFIKFREGVALVSHRTFTWKDGSHNSGTTEKFSRKAFLTVFLNKSCMPSSTDNDKSFNIYFFLPSVNPSFYSCNHGIYQVCRRRTRTRFRILYCKDSRVDWRNGITRK